MLTTKKTSYLLFLFTISLTLAFLLPNNTWQVQADEPSTPTQNTPITLPALSLTYATVLTANVPVYSQIWHPTASISPARTLGNGFVWLSLKHPKPIIWQGQAWHWINHNEYVEAKYLYVYQPATFQGKTATEIPTTTFAWLLLNTPVSTEAGVEALPNATWLTRYTFVNILESKEVDDWQWYKIGPEQWIEQRRLGVVTHTPPPEGIALTEHWIDINLYEQTLAAYEGEKMVYATLLSSGLPQWPTKQGLFRIWTKVKQAKMSGAEGLPDYYYLEDVPWTMYFDGSYALHTAYWHNNFGFVNSHGCLNLTPTDARWLFNWVTPNTGPTNWTMATAKTPGTWVWIHE